MPELSGLDTVEVDEGRTGSYDYTFDDIHSDTEVETSLFENDEDVRGDTYWTGAFAEPVIVLPDLDDDGGTNRESDLTTIMANGDYARVRLTKNNGDTLVIDKTKIRIVQNTNSNVGNLDTWEMRLRDVDTSGIFSW